MADIATAGGAGPKKSGAAAPDRFGSITDDATVDDSGSVWDADAYGQVGSSVIYAAGDYLAEQSRVETERERIRVAEELGREAAEEAFRAEQAQSDAIRNQRDRQVSRLIADERRAALESRSLSRVMAGESGTTGKTVDQLDDEFARIETLNTFRLAEARRAEAETEGFEDAAAVGRMQQRTPDFDEPEFNTVAGLMNIMNAGAQSAQRVDQVRTQNLR